MLIIYVIVRIDSKGPGIYVQERIGKEGKPFNLYKFRSMRIASDKLSQLTVGKEDPRITKVGKFIRKFKLDELPQLWNVLINDMSIVGPRPEVAKYVNLYTSEQRHVLAVKPGISDYASLIYINENEILARSADPHKTYIDVVMPRKIRLNLIYINNKSLKTYLDIIIRTIKHILK